MEVERERGKRERKCSLSSRFQSRTKRRRSSSRNKRDITSGRFSARYGRARKYLAVNETDKFPERHIRPFLNRLVAAPLPSPFHRSAITPRAEKGGRAWGHFPTRGQSRHRSSLYVRQFRETILTFPLPLFLVVHSITILLSVRCRFKFSLRLSLTWLAWSCAGSSGHSSVFPSWSFPFALIRVSTSGYKVVRRSLAYMIIIVTFLHIHMIRALKKKSCGQIF